MKMTHSSERHLRQNPKLGVGTPFQDQFRPPPPRKKHAPFFQWIYYYFHLDFKLTSSTFLAKLDVVVVLYE